jgi:hypothetical protein
MGGLYCENTDVAPIELTDPSHAWTPADSTSHTGVMPYAIDPEAAGRLWSVSSELLGLQGRLDEIQIEHNSLS